MPLCVPFTNCLIELYFIMIFVVLLLGFLWQLFYCELHVRLSDTNFWFCKCAPPWMCPPLDNPYEYIGLNMLPSDSFVSCLDSLLGYSTGEFQVLQLIVLAVLGTVD